MSSWDAVAFSGYRPAVEMNEEGQPVGAAIHGWSPRPMPERVVLAGRYVTAEPIDKCHSDALFAALSCPDDEPLWTYRPAPRPTSIATFAQEVVQRLAQHSESASYAFTPAGGTASGLATFFPCVSSSGVVEISGVLLGRAMQQTTAATEAIHLMLRYAFDQLGYRRVEWKCDSLNEPSGRAALRLGFACEGRFRQHMVVKGRNRDTDWYSMLDSEWPEIRARHERWLDPVNFDAGGRQLQRLATL